MTQVISCLTTLSHFSGDSPCAVGNIELHYIIGSRREGCQTATPQGQVTPASQSAPVPTPGTPPLGKPSGHQSPARCLCPSCPSLRSYLMQSTALITPKFLWKLGPSRANSPQHLCGQSAPMTPSCWEAWGSCALAEERDCASLCGQLPAIFWTSSLQLGAGAQEAAVEAPLPTQNPIPLLLQIRSLKQQRGFSIPRSKQSRK